MILTCTCKNEQQDRFHGLMKRVFNPLKKGPKMPQLYRCTICGREKEESK